MTIIKITPEPDGYHVIESQSHRVENWMGAEWIAVPSALEGAVLSSGGWLDLHIQDGVLQSVTAKEPPAPEVPGDAPPTLAERNRADIDFLAAMTGVAL